MNFWIACQGHSGSTWLAHVLGVGDHVVRHEDADPHTMDDPHYWAPFPVQRWRGRSKYGEVHGHLRRYLSPEYEGPEREIPRRAVLLRDVEAIIRSAMRHERLEMLLTVRERVERAERQLLDYAAADLECRVVRLEELSGNMRAVLDLREWLGIRGRLSARDMEPRNVSERGT